MTPAPPPPPPVASYDAATAALCRANLADDPTDANERAEALTLAVASAGTLLGVLERASDYLQRRLGPVGAPASDPE